MSTFTFPKDMRGGTFRVEVGFVSPPRVSPAPEQEGENPPSGPLLVGQPLVIEADVLGFPAGESVEFRIFEPYRLHDGALETFTAQTADEDRGVSVDWTFDYAAHKDSIHSTRFVCVAQCGRLVNISEPFEVLAPFERVLQDPSGAPLAHAAVRLRAPGRADVVGETDAEGKLSLLVQPGDYIVELIEELDGPIPQPFGAA